MVRNKPLRIEVPRQENVRLGRVGLIAAGGFAIGILWPHLAGLRFVPNVPNEDRSDKADELAAVPSVASVAPAPAPGPPPAQPTREPFTIGPADVTSCRDEAGKKVTACDAVDFDALARGRLSTLAACEAARRAKGVLSVGFTLDFQKDRVTGIEVGKSTSLPQADVDALLRCLNQTLGEASLTGIRHEHARYSVFYRLDFEGPVEPDAEAGASDASAAAEVTPASGSATVAWDVALVRKGPSRDDEVVARLLQGVRVNVTGRRDNWYRVAYDAKGSQGWVFRTAIGM